MPNLSEPVHKTLLGFDFGMKHIGVAVGQTITQTASPVTTLQARDGIPNWTELQALIDRWKPSELVVGVPFNMDGSSQLMTFCARRFIKRLTAKFNLPIHEVDERLTSWEAKTRNEFKLKKSKTKRKDQEDHATAAVIIVEQWMADQK